MKPNIATFARIPVTIALAALVATTGAASATDRTPKTVVETEFATLALMAEPPGAHGMVRGALTIDLKPGWKTYWLDPGPSGIPPQIDFSGTDGVEKAVVLAPLPQRFGEDLARANGYKHDLSLPFLLTPGAGQTIDGTITASVFLGVCDDICVPVQAELSAAPASEGAVEIAFGDLPQTIDPGAVTASMEGDTLTLALRSDAALNDVFVIGPAGWYFGEAEATGKSGGETTFRIPIDERPRDAESPELTAVFDDGERGLTAVVRPD